MGLAVRVAFVLHFENPSPLAGDAGYYHHVANLLADGWGFVDPIRHAPDATHPPAYTLVLALASALGFRSVLDHQLWSCIVGSGVVVAVGLTGREIVDDTTGLVAAALAAVYPAFWINDGLLMSETLVQLVVAVLVLFVYRALRRPTIGNAIAVGAAAGVAALTRGELILLPLILVLPLIWSVVRRKRREALAFAAAAVVAVAVVMLPWTVYNLSRFERPVVDSTQSGATVAGANCPATYQDRTWIGLWNYTCVLFNQPDRKAARGHDQSAVDAMYMRKGVGYATAHASRLPVVVLARVGRVVGVYRPRQQLDVESRPADGRPFSTGVAALLGFYVVAVAGVVGLVLLRRRKVPIWPVVVFAGLVVVTAATTYGATRFRDSLEVALMVPAATAFVHGWTARPRKRVPGARNLPVRIEPPSAPEPGEPPVPARR